MRKILKCDSAPFFAGVTPFMCAAQSGDLSTVKYFLDHGGDLMKSDEKGRTVLHHAACSGCPLCHRCTFHLCLVILCLFYCLSFMDSSRLLQEAVR